MRLMLGFAVAAAVMAATPALAGAPEALIAQAERADRAGKLDDATVLYQAAMVADPLRPQSYVALAGFYARHGDADFAYKYYGQALGIDPTQKAALEGAGRASLALGERSAAEAMLARLRHLCGGKCAPADQLAAAIAATPPAPPSEQKAALDK